MFRTVPLSIIRSFAMYTQQYIQVCWQQVVIKPVWYIPLLCLQWKTADDGQRNCPKRVEFYSKNKFEKLVHVVGFIIIIYHDARSPERHKICYLSIQYMSQYLSHVKFKIIITLPNSNTVFFLWRCVSTRATDSSFLRFLDHTRRITVGRTPLYEWSARRRDLYLTTHNTRNRQTFMLTVGFEPTIPAGERPHTYALDRAATGTGITSL